MNKIITPLFILLSFFCFGQQMPIDFSSSNHTFSTFGGSGFTNNQSPTDNSNNVGQFSNGGSSTTEGFFIDLSREIDLSHQRTISLSFYSLDANSHSITLKLEQGGSDADIEITKSNITSHNTWTNNITFDFGTDSGTYNRLTLFIDLGTAVAGTYYLDDIDDGTTPTDPNAIDVTYDVLAWSDEFDMDGPVDATKWHHQTIGPNGGQWFNGEQQHYTHRTDNSYVQNGNLYIVAKKENYTSSGVTLGYTSARLNSKYAFRYGRVDVRAKLPLGAGTWPAIWTLGKNITEQGGYWQTQGFGTTGWPDCGELDIMEHGLHAVNEVSSAIHTRSSHGATVNTDTYQLSDVHNDWHVYSMNWSPNQVTFLVDGVGYYTYNPSDKNADTWPFDLEQYLLLNIAMGGIGGTIDPNFTESPMVIDYVRVYQSAEILSTNTFEGQEAYIKMYPNPSSDVTNIVSANTIQSISVYNVLGKNTLNKKVNASSYQLDLSTFSKGIYMIKVQTNGSTVMRKLLVN